MSVVQKGHPLGPKRYLFRNRCTKGYRFGTVVQKGHPRGPMYKVKVYLHLNKRLHGLFKPRTLCNRCKYGVVGLAEVHDQEER